VEGISDEWEGLKLNKQLLMGVAGCGFAQPTEIQRRCIPAIIGGQQVIGIAQTGTGKTAAYLIPVLLKLRFRQLDIPRAVVLAPTKELVIQIAQHAKALAAHTDLRICPLYGGIGPKAQMEELAQGIDLIVSTPGRFMELYVKEGIPTKSIHTLVIDEADRMMDLNFMPQLRKILEVIPTKRQNLLFSATFSPRVDKMAQEFLDFPLKIEVTPQATAAKMYLISELRLIYCHTGYRRIPGVGLSFLRVPVKRLTTLQNIWNERAWVLYGLFMPTRDKIPESMPSVNLPMEVYEFW
jgi:ATP-dependent RNA helicase RhlE